ncbi:hypothetical protein AUEXF2481DRAFT_40038 [Aureobasidium subglaciale EXF-2481]|uniref:Mitotic checkpoint regulator, MAD2B-interacting-domain-containing protein n=1 Tax=Aureobasidium subglaciale (strain EXF-2481) TaxID=1043005 RepID=A0A074Z9J8_AURSE|nr:uncharacterized protein AUEXF2481DRAFT_40038 [Aureobasidium subglaciale EXF-2481]KAI5195149.1 hypothetical protein E4T38_09227 [Aureobasidium subglaciale]KAI5214218.1 hypothetical protein E4T40_09141 [Aureobasidium subglaciale]KAI5216757.1 hypothetical protein E4T41_09142 [Aureobasidium subglaciale]KAI5254483.1 hypothetical protein E4T46_09134 [Aureobasidium subglaciale]KEQ95481.1 hypothetical protein AUEXF2481DRAFT_40038 [Aureobasidium subglaciale EXF-2481]
MALVGYSDSEGSDSETPNVAPIPATKATTKKGNFQKLVDPSAPRKIKVDLPTVQPEAETNAPPAKRARTAGTFGGFNSFLPAPKRAADAKKGLGSGVNLKTGAEPAFSRERVEPDPSAFTPASTTAQTKDDVDTSIPAPFQDEPPKEVKPKGNAMKFKPLSVARKKAPKKNIIPGATSTAQSPITPAVPETPKASAPKPKVSLFSVTQDNDTPSAAAPLADYQPLLAEPEVAETETFNSTMAAPPPVPVDPNSLTAIADDLGLSANERRRLFGRNKDAAAFANVTHLNMEEEYNNNEQLRAQGAAVEHRAVKAVAPGKHSLQQLVNSASTQKEALEDAWAQGRRNKAEAGSHYGF